MSVHDIATYLVSLRADIQSYLNLFLVRHYTKIVNVAVRFCNIQDINVDRNMTQIPSQCISDINQNDRPTISVTLLIRATGLYQ